MPKESDGDGYGKFVRVKLINEIVEVVSFDSDGITVNFRGQNIKLSLYDVSHVTPEEAAEAANRISNLDLR